MALGHTFCSLMVKVGSVWSISSSGSVLLPVNVPASVTRDPGGTVAGPRRFFLNRHTPTLRLGTIGRWSLYSPQGQLKDGETCMVPKAFRCQDFVPDDQGFTLTGEGHFLYPGIGCLWIHCGRYMW